MRLLRTAVYEDKKAFRQLWDLCFDDSKKFSDWLFDNRFVPEYSVCTEEEDGSISSEIQGLPLFLQVRGKIVPSVMTAGVCTHPDYRHQGYMKELYTYYMNMVREKGIALCPNTPVSIGMYYCVGNYPVSDIMLLKTEKAEKLPYCEYAKTDLKGDISGLLQCYNIATSDWSGAAKRSFADFSLKRYDYIAGDGKCISIEKNGKTEGYAVYFEDEKGVYGEEIIARNTETEQALCEILINIADGRKAELKLAAFSKVNIDGCEKQILAKNVCGITDVTAFLKLVGKPLDIAIKIDDDIISKNNGVFFMDGGRSTKTPQLEMKIYALAQWLFGYRSLKELEARGFVKVYDKTAAAGLDRLFPKEKCRIIDEY